MTLRTLMQSSKFNKKIKQMKADDHLKIALEFKVDF